MNTEVISSRYAKALLSYVMERGIGERVCSQIEEVLRNMQELPQLREYILKADDISLEKKLELLSAAAGGNMADELRDFVRLVYEKRRMELLQIMLLAFISRYREALGVKVGSLLTAVPSEELCHRLETMLSREGSSKACLKAEVDPDLIGGFVFEIDGYRMDASVRTKLRKISEELIDNSSRIV